MNPARQFAANARDASRTSVSAGRRIGHPRPRRVTSARHLPTGGGPGWAEVNAISSADLGGRGGPRWAEVNEDRTQNQERTP
jgi:hypothetical protein